MHSHKLRALVCASILFGAPAALIAAPAESGATPPSTRLVAADDGASPSAATRPAATAKDAAITAQVKSRLLADPEVKGMRIDVDTRDQVVTLSGTAQSEAQLLKALTLAAQVEGVVSVANQLTLTGTTASLEGSISPAPRSAATTLKDAAISTSVKTKLLTDPDVAGTKIDVDTRNKVVKLSGTVASEAQVREAVLIASEVDGVARVHNELKVAQH